MLVLSEFKYGDKVVIDSKIKSEIFSDEDISICLFNFTFLNEYNICFGREKYEHAIHNCYFGLMKKYNFNDISEGQIILNNLKVDNKIDQKIFSFGIWDLGLSEIKSTFFLGYVHQNFTSKNGTNIIKKDKNKKIPVAKFKKSKFQVIFPISQFTGKIKLKKNKKLILIEK